MSAYVSIRQITSAYVSIRQHTSAYLRGMRSVGLLVVRVGQVLILTRYVLELRFGRPQALMHIHTYIHTYIYMYICIYIYIYIYIYICILLHIAYMLHLQHRGVGRLYLEARAMSY
jgi:hypothetical protein